MIDTHCHLTDPRLAAQLSAVLDRAAAAGVARMITIGTGLEDDIAAVAVCQGRPHLRCAVGVHPNHSHEMELADLPTLERIQDDPAVVALGEMGLDYFHSHAPRPRQFEVFEFQLDLATRLGRPVVIHSREATDDTLAVLKRFPSVRSLFHCFTGSASDARKILDQGYMLGFTGAVTFKKNDFLRDVVRFTPLDRMVIETDAPYLTPEPVRHQKTNEPALVAHVARTVALARGATVEEIDHVTTQNAQAFFGWGA